MKRDQLGSAPKLDRFLPYLVSQEVVFKKFEEYQELIYRKRPADLKKGSKSNGGYRRCFLRTVLKWPRDPSLIQNRFAGSSFTIRLRTAGCCLGTRMRRCFSSHEIVTCCQSGAALAISSSKRLSASRQQISIFFPRAEMTGGASACGALSHAASAWALPGLMPIVSKSLSLGSAS